MQAITLTKDLLPEEVNSRKTVLRKITAIFEKNGYAEIITPTFESYQKLAQGLSCALLTASYLFFDHTGEQKVLRPDITTQVARVVSTKMADHRGPLRLYYSGDVYRAKHLDIGQANQFHQVGVELFDCPGKKGDAEILALTEKSLRAIGLRDFIIEKTDSAELKKLSPEKRQSLLNQDFVRLGRLPQKNELLSMDLDYYTGLYFECFVPELGYILGSGGRYDKLCSAFGISRPAVGFAFDLDKLMLALNAQKRRSC